MRTPTTLALLALLALSVPSSAQDKPDKPDENKPDAAEQDTKQASIIAFVGGRVLTGTGKVHAPGAIVVKDGVIEAVGRLDEVEIPEGAKRIDAKGYWLAPGAIVSKSCSIGHSGRGDWVGRFDRFHQELELLHAVGITAYYTSDGSSPTRPSDRNAVYRVVRDQKTKDVVLKQPVCVEMNFAGARPSQKRGIEKLFTDARAHLKAMEAYHAKVEQWKKDLEAWRKREAEKAKQAKAAAEAEAKKTEAQKKAEAAKQAAEAKKKAEAAKKMAEAQKKEAAKQAAEAKKKAAEEAKQNARPKAPTPPKASAQVKALAQVLEGKLPLRVSGMRARELRAIVALCKRHKIFAPIVEGAGEGWVVGPELASVGARAVVSPRQRFGPRFEGDDQSGWTIENAHRLQSAGVDVALCTPSTGFAYWGITGDDALTFRLCAAFAIRGGMSDADGLAGITSRAAKILGVGDHIGSLTAGRHADIVFYDSDPLHYRSLVEKVYMSGRLQYERHKSTWLKHIKK